MKRMLLSPVVRNPRGWGELAGFIGATKAAKIF
jgi:hypothetical protein